MKNKYLLPLVVYLSCCCLAGCSQEKINLTYGTLINHTTFSLTELNNEELYNRLYEKEETLLLAVYQGAYSEDCLCWSTFETAIANYINNYHENIYIFNAQNIDDSLNNLEIRKLQTSTPILYIFKGDNKIASFSYDNKADKALFEDLNGTVINKKIHQYVNRPKIYYVDCEYIEENIQNNNNFVVALVREGCGDCSYVLPNVIIPYVYQSTIVKDVWILDMQNVYNLSKNSLDEEEKMQYQLLKNYYHLSSSSDSKFGYLEGVVPTLQFYEEGELSDVCVYFNDVIDKNGDKYYISNSFYTEERVENLKYTTSVLKNLEIPEEEIVETKNGSYYWLQEKAAQKHNAIARSFLDMYLY